MDAATPLPTTQVLDWSGKIAELLKDDPERLILFIVILFLMVIIYWEKREKKAFVFNTLDTLADQIDVLANEVSSLSKAQIQQTTLLQTTISFAKDTEGEAHVKTTRKQRNQREAKSDIPEGGEDSS